MQMNRNREQLTSLYGKAATVVTNVCLEIASNQKKIEHMQRRAGHIVLKNSQELSSDAIIG